MEEGVEQVVFCLFGLVANTVLLFSICLFIPGEPSLSELGDVVQPSNKSSGSVSESSAKQSDSVC